MKQKQIWSISVASMIIWVEAALALLFSALVTFMGTTLPTQLGITNFAGYFTTASILGVLISLGMIIVGYFLWKHKTWAWWTAFILAILTLVASLYGLTAISVMTFLAIPLAVIEAWVLWVKETRKVCKVKF